MRLTIIVLLMILSFSCATKYGAPIYDVEVDSISSLETKGKKVFIQSSSSSLDELRQKELTKVVTRVLQRIGYVEVDNERKSDISIRLSSSIDSKSFSDINSAPVNIYNPSQGYRYSSSLDTKFFYKLKISARDSKTKKQVWETLISSKGEVEDPRSFFTYMLIGAESLIGKNTDRRVVVRVFSSEHRHLADNLRQLDGRIPASDLSMISNPNHTPVPSSSQKAGFGCMKNSDCPSGKVCATSRGEYPGSCANGGFGF